MEGRDQLRSREAPEELDKGRQAGLPLQTAGSGRVLALQCSAGNRSLSAILARDPDDPPPEQGPTPMTTGGAGLVTLPDIGAIPVSSATFGGASESTHMGGGGSRSRSSLHEMHFTSSAGDHSVKLTNALAAGTSMSADVSVAAFQLKLTGAILSTYNVSGGETPTESWSLNFASVQ